jgi:GNAT superfamily N-acetyltransferase
MKIRLCDLSEARKVAEIHVATWKEAYRDIVPAVYLNSLSIEKRELAWQKTLEQNRSELWVAVDNAAELIGFTSFSDNRGPPPAPSIGELTSLYVLPSYWSCGVGRALWLTARNRLVEKGCIGITVWCLAGNHRAERFYQAAGFIQSSDTVATQFGNVILEKTRYLTRIAP